MQVCLHHCRQSRDICYFLGSSWKAWQRSRCFKALTQWQNDFLGMLHAENSVWISSKTFAWCMLLATSEVPSIITLMGRWGGGRRGRGLWEDIKEKCGPLSENLGHPAFWFSGIYSLACINLSEAHLREHRQFSPNCIDDGNSNFHFL